MKLRVNPIRCAGHGSCAELLPELITLDPWGFPVLKPTAVPRELAEHARRAVAACPALALALLTDRLAVRLVVTVPGATGVGRGGRHAG